jgi:hypothetical protein
MDKVRNPSNSACYTPSSEPYRIYEIPCYEIYRITELCLSELTAIARAASALDTVTLVDKLEEEKLDLNSFRLSRGSQMGAIGQ